MLFCRATCCDCIIIIYRTQRYGKKEKDKEFRIQPHQGRPRWEACRPCQVDDEDSQRCNPWHRAGKETRRKSVLREQYKVAQGGVGVLSYQRGGGGVDTVQERHPLLRQHLLQTYDPRRGEEHHPARLPAELPPTPRK